MRRTAALRIALAVLGVVLLGVALALCLLPGPVAACGSLLAPMFPLQIAARCLSSQDANLIPALVSGSAGFGALAASMILRPNHTRRRRRS